jgi:hypothetical protein
MGPLLVGAMPWRLPTPAEILAPRGMDHLRVRLDGDNCAPCTETGRPDDDPDQWLRLAKASARV